MCIRDSSFLSSILSPLSRKLSRGPSSHPLVRYVYSYSLQENSYRASGWNGGRGTPGTSQFFDTRWLSVIVDCAPIPPSIPLFKCSRAHFGARVWVVTHSPDTLAVVWACVRARRPPSTPIPPSQTAAGALLCGRWGLCVVRRRRAAGWSVVLGQRSYPSLPDGRRSACGLSLIHI